MNKTNWNLRDYLTWADHRIAESQAARDKRSSLIARLAEDYSEWFRQQQNETDRLRKNSERDRAARHALQSPPEKPKSRDDINSARHAGEVVQYNSAILARQRAHELAERQAAQLARLKDIGERTKPAPVAPPPTISLSMPVSRSEIAASRSQSERDTHKAEDGAQRQAEELERQQAINELSGTDWVAEAAREARQRQVAELSPEQAAIYRWLQARGPSTAREIGRSGVAGIANAQDASVLLDQLRALNLVDAVTDRVGRGRPTTRFKIAT